MNDAIKTLYDQSLTREEFTDINGNKGLRISQNPAKFAELVVRECIETIRNESMNSGDEWEEGLRIAENAISERFGVH